MMGDITKKVIIVTSEKDEEYGELLSALVAMKDDKDEIITKYEAVIWNEEQYYQNRAQLGSSNKIIFIGDMDASKPIGKNITFFEDFFDYGVYYGHLANKALIKVNDKILANSKELYDSFINDYSSFVSKAGELYADTQMTERYLVLEDFKEEKNEKKRNILAYLKRKILRKNKTEEVQISDKTLNNVNKACKTIKLLVPVFWPGNIIEVSGEGMIKSISKKIIKEQQFRCAILAFYLNEFSKFME